jgi:hypothetical protein
MKMFEVNSFGTSVNIYQTTRRNVPEDSHHKNWRHAAVMAETACYKYQFRIPAMDLFPERSCAFSVSSSKYRDNVLKYTTAEFIQDSFDSPVLSLHLIRR